MESGTAEWPAIAARLERLEKQNRRMKQLGAMVLLVVGSVFLMGQAAPTPRIVEANEFIVKDTNGRVRGRFGIPPHLPLTNGPALSLMDEKGTTRLELSFDKQSESSRLKFSNEDGNPRLSLYLADGNPYLWMQGNQEGFQGLVELFVEDNVAKLAIRDAQGKMLWKAP
jgi:hypothetical protein